MKVLEDSKTGYCNLRAKLRDITERWHLKTSKEKFLSLYSIPKWMFEVVGLRVYGDCKLTIYSYFGYVVVVYYLSMVTYTIYYWSCKGQFIYGLRCLCGVGIMISSFPLYIKSIGEDRFKFNSLLNFTADYMYENDRQDASQYSMVCRNGAKKLFNSYAIMTCVMFTSMSLVTLGPMHLFLTTGIWISPLGIQFPYADQSDIAFWLDLAIQVTVGILGTLSTVSIELAQVILNNVIDMGADVATLNANEIGAQLLIDGRMNHSARFKFRNMKVQLQDFDRFISDFMDVFYWRTFLGPFALAFATAFCTFCQFILDFRAGYGTAAASYIQMLILCYTGHNVQHANEQIYEALNEIPWYAMPVNEQKDFGHLLFRLQNGLSLTMGPLGELNYEMASDLTKRIYQCLMLLVQFGS